MRRFLTPVLLSPVIAALAGCTATSTVQLSSLGREVDVQPLRGQSIELLAQDDVGCESWARSTKGPNEPLPAAELRYSACAMSRGYSVKPWNHRIGPPGNPAPDLASVVADLQACRIKAGLYDGGSRGYSVNYQPDARAESIRKK